MILLDTNVVSELMRRTPEPTVVAWLDVQEASARSYASIGAARKAAGMPIGHADCQIAAIARTRGARVATRNDGDFGHCGIEVINPWPATPDTTEAQLADGA